MAISYHTSELQYLIRQLKDGELLPAELEADHFVVSGISSALASPNTRLELSGSDQFPSLKEPLIIDYDRSNFGRLIGGLRLPYYGDEVTSRALIETACTELSSLPLPLDALLDGLTPSSVPHRRQDFNHSFEVDQTSLLWNGAAIGDHVPYDTRYLLDHAEGVVGLDLSTAVLYQDMQATIPAAQENDPVALAFACGRGGLETRSLGLGENPRVFLTMTGYMAFEGGVYELPQDRLDDYYYLTGIVETEMDHSMILEILDGYQSDRVVAQITIQPRQVDWKLLFTPLTDRIRVRLITDDSRALVKIEDIELITTPHFIQEYEPARPRLTYVDHQTYLRCGLNQYLSAQTMGLLSGEGTMFFQHLPQTSLATDFSHVLGGLYNSVSNLAQLSYSALQGAVDFDVQSSTGQWEHSYRFVDSDIQNTIPHTVVVSWSRDALRYEGRGVAQYATQHPLNGAVGESLRFRIGGENNYPTVVRRVLFVPTDLLTRQTQALARFGLDNG